MEDLKTKWVKWKTKIVFEKWRMKAWSDIEERNMKKYLKEVNIKYPPVCTEKLLNNNPYGLVIPSTLVFEKFKNWRREFEREASGATKLFIVSDELPLIKLNRILGKPLEARARR